jgi:hypothetical protein
MKTYPVIEYKINGNIHVYAFDKLDGSNIRVEWTIKKGFWKHGTRRRLLDPKEEPLGEAVDLINEKYSEALSKIFYDNKWGRVISFFEFWGPNSFAGNHEDEQHTVTLIDVNPYKKGILPPKEFIDLFEGKVEIPSVLHNGRIGPNFVKAVRDGDLDNMTFEGVVCKGVRKSRHLTMFKIKSRAWIKKVKESYGHDEARIQDLLDASELISDSPISFRNYRRRRFCPSCFRSGSLSPICRCGSSTMEMPYEAQPPRKKASKSRWRKFFQEWYPDLDFKMHWKGRT